MLAPHSLRDLPSPKFSYQYKEFKFSLSLYSRDRENQQYSDVDYANLVIFGFGHFTLKILEYSKIYFIVNKLTDLTQVQPLK